MTYSPMPNGVTIGPSQIHGNGVIATSDLPTGFDLGITHHLFPNCEDPMFRVVRTPAGGWLNHSDEPNCVKIEENGPLGKCWRVYTTSAIPAGTELTISYTLYSPNSD